MNKMKFVRPLSDGDGGIDGWELKIVLISTKKDSMQRLKKCGSRRQTVRRMAARGYAPLNQFPEGQKRHISRYIELTLLES